MTGTIIGAAVLTAMLGLASAAFAQQRNTQGMSMLEHHDTGGMDMQAMMTQCAQMRRQMRPGTRMTPEMQRMMTQCDAMDRQMGTSTSSGAPPATRNR